MKTQESRDLEEYEEQARQVLRGELARLLDLAARTFQTIAQTMELSNLQESQTGSTARKVASLLLGRLSSDIRSVFLLAESGYMMQAASISASALEVALTIPFIGTDEALANKWAIHNSTKPWRTVRDLIRGAYDRYPQLRESDKLYDDVYSPLARCKHANPNAQRYYTLESGATNGPSTTLEAICLAEHSLLAAIQSGSIALASFADAFLAPEQRDVIAKPLALIRLEYVELAGLHNARGKES